MLISHCSWKSRRGRRALMSSRLSACASTLYAVNTAQQRCFKSPTTRNIANSRNSRPLSLIPNEIYHIVQVQIVTCFTGISMPTIHYYGKKTNYVGKTLFEILANLRNFGLNRMLLKQEEILRYPDKRSYYIVKKVEPKIDDELKQGAIYAERIYKNRRMPGLAFVDWESWHPDWQLVPKHEECNYIVENPELYEEPKIENKYIEIPPLMKLFLQKKGINDAKIPLYNDNKLIDEEKLEFVDKPMHTLLKERFRNQ